MPNIWLTSDTHFNHDKDFVWKARGFANVHEMNETIIQNWNKVVKPDDIVYHLGDVMLGQDLQAGLRMIARLNGEKYLAYGNHVTDARLKAFGVNHFFKDIQMGYRIKGPGKRICILTHYPTVTANGEDTRVLSLYGHTHQTTNFFDDGTGIRKYMYHIGVDSHNCTPVNLEDVIAEINKI